MRFFYGDNNILRLLDEVEFWKLQEYEHTFVVEQIVPNLESNFRQRLMEFRESFGKTQAQAVQIMETFIRSKGMVNPEFTNQTMSFIQFAMNESQEFVDFLNEVITQSSVVQGNMVAVTVINHIIRESKYFIGIVQTILFQ